MKKPINKKLLMKLIVLLLMGLFSNLAQPQSKPAERPFICVATDVASLGTVVLHSGSLVEALLASSAVPCLFPSILMNEKALVDGLASSNLSVETALAYGGALRECMKNHGSASVGDGERVIGRESERDSIVSLRVTPNNERELQNEKSRQQSVDRKDRGKPAQ